GRSLRRDVLLGFVFHDARPRRKRTRGPDAFDGGQLRLPDRYLRPHPQWQPHVLPEPLATAGVRADGGVARAPWPVRGVALPAAAAARARVLDGRCRRIAT